MTTNFRKLASSIALFLLLTLPAACGGLSVERTEFAPGQVLILPPRDVVQGGKPHDKGVGSGERLQQKLKESLARYKAWVVVVPEGGEFDHTSIASKDSAVAAAKSAGADYALQVVLGEFRNAAPMSFRTDFVVLESAVMWRTESGEEVWRLRKPTNLSKGNLGSHLGLIDRIAAAIAKSIAR